MLESSFLFLLRELGLPFSEMAARDGVVLFLFSFFEALVTRWSGEVDAIWLFFRTALRGLGPCRWKPLTFSFSSPL